MNYEKLSEDRKLNYDDEKYFNVELQGILNYNPNDTYNDIVNVLNETKIQCADIINMFGGLKQIAILPVLDIKERVGYTDYIDFLSPKDLTDPIMRGIDIYKRPFIAVRYINRTSGETRVETFFQRYTDNRFTWTTGGGSELSSGLSPVSSNISGLLNAKSNVATQISKSINDTFAETNLTAFIGGIFGGNETTTKKSYLKHINDNFVENKKSEKLYENYCTLLTINTIGAKFLLIDRMRRLLGHHPVGNSVYSKNMQESDIRVTKDGKPIIELI